MTTTTAKGEGAARPAPHAVPRTEFPRATLRFEWINTGLALLWLGGLYLDGWAHNHGKVDNTFFTPWHAVLYGTFFLFGLYLTLNYMGNLKRGYSLRRALPRGYVASFGGVLLFAFGGGFDFIWHSLFGFEASTEALLSPAHLLLATGLLLAMSGPLRAGAARAMANKSPGWAGAGPMILSTACVLAVLTFFTQFTHPFLGAAAISRSQVSSSISAILVQTALMMGATLWLSMHRRLPPGALTLMLLGTAALITTFGDSYAVLPGVAITSLIAEALYRLLQPRPDGPERMAVFGFVVPVVYYIAYFITVQLDRGLYWSIHLWAGSVLMAGVVGMLLALLMTWPRPAAPEA